MSIELKIEATDAADLRRQLSELLGGTAQAAATPIVEAKVVAPKAEKAKPEPKPEPVAEVQAELGTAETEGLADDPSIVTESEIAFPAATGVPSEAELKDPAGFYLTTVKPHVLKVSAKHGRPGVEKLLAEFDVPNASHIPQEKYPALFAAIDKMLGA